MEAERVTVTGNRLAYFGNTRKADGDLARGEQSSILSRLREGADDECKRAGLIKADEAVQVIPAAGGTDSDKRSAATKQAESMIETVRTIPGDDAAEFADSTAAHDLFVSLALRLFKDDEGMLDLVAMQTAFATSQMIKGKVQVRGIVKPSDPRYTVVKASEVKAS